MACKLVIKVAAFILFLAGLCCFPASHALYVNQKVATGMVTPSLCVRLIDIAGIVLLVAAVLIFVLSPFLTKMIQRSKGV